MTHMTTDEKYMAKAIELAEKARGCTSPNPMVGAIIVKDGRIIGEGYHQKAGEPHAEVYALHQAGMDARGATLYVTLEPCSHYGKTPPCAKRVIAAGISRVVIGMIDPNPLVAGKGLAMLQEAGIEVEIGVLERQCVEMNEAFITYIKTGKPFVILKSAMSIDGKIATASGESKWITNEEARIDGHRIRKEVDAMLVGVGTIIADDPLLSCRLPQETVENQPHLYILDSQGRTPLDATIWTVPNRNITIFVGEECGLEQMGAFSDKGAEVIVTPSNERGLDISFILEELGARQCMSLLIEGGSQVVASFVETKSFDKLVTYIGNRIIGGIGATPAVGGLGFSSLDEAVQLDIDEVMAVGDNMKIISYRRGREGVYVYGDH